MRPLARAACCCCNQNFCQQLGYAFVEVERVCESCGLRVSACLGDYICPPHRPSPIFLIYTVLFNAIPAVFHSVAAIKLLTRSCRADCDMGLLKFLLATVALNIFFCAFAKHVYSKFSAPYTSPLPEQRSPLYRAYDLVMDDPWVSVFIVAVLLCIPTVFIGFGWDVEGSCDCYPELPACVGSASIMLLLYLLGAGIISALSLAVEVFRRSDAETEDPFNPAASAGLLGRLNPFGGAPPPPRPSTDVPLPGAAAAVAAPGSGYAAYQAAVTGQQPLVGYAGGSSGKATQYGTVGQAIPQPGASAPPASGSLYPSVTAAPSQATPFSGKPPKTVD